MILSRDNARVKWMRSLLEAKGRKQEDCFLVEGAIQADEALSAGLEPRLILYDSAALQASRRGRLLLERMASLHAEEVSATVLQSICDTVTPQGIVMALPIPPAPPALPESGLVVVLDALRDPGNAGTILRTAEAAGCAAVVATTDSVDLYSPKVVRAAMGAHLRLALLTDIDWAHLQPLLARRAVYLAEAGDGAPYFAIDWTKAAVLVIGNETEGLRPDAQRCASGRVSIPMPGRAESLNAAVAASIIIFESVRQTYLHIRENAPKGA
jgi:RNA methyltransferase, TrmH family